MPPTINDVARAVAREETYAAFQRVGFDLDDQEDTRRLFEVLRWASLKREQEIKAASSMTGVLWLIASTAIGAVTTVAVQWFAATKGWGGSK